VRQIDLRALAKLLALAIPSLAGATLAVALLEEYIGVPNASTAYLAAVVATAVVVGTSGAIVAAIASFLLYDFLFVLPLYTFTVADPGEWLNLILLLFIGIVVGQLVATQRSRTEVATAREREARALFQVSRELATRESMPAVLLGLGGAAAGAALMAGGASASPADAALDGTLVARCMQPSSRAGCSRQRGRSRALREVGRRHGRRRSEANLWLGHPRPIRLARGR
jgi:hypothetical protein